MLIRAFYHVYITVQTQVCTGHGQCRSPLSGSCLCSYAFQALFLGVISLCNSGIQFVASGSIISLKFVVNFCRSIQCFFKAISPYQRGRTVHFIKIQNFLRNIKICSLIIQFLFYQFITKYMFQFFCGHRLQRAGIQKWCRFIFHICTHVIPLFWHFIFFEIDFIRNFGVFSHSVASFFIVLYHDNTLNYLIIKRYAANCQGALVYSMFKSAWEVTTQPDG